MDRCGLSSDPSAEDLPHSTVADFWRSLAAQDQPPTFQLVAANTTKAVDGNLAAPCRRVGYGDVEDVAALGANSSKVAGHGAESYRSDHGRVNRGFFAPARVIFSGNDESRTAIDLACRDAAR